MNKERFNDLLIAMVLCENGVSDLLFIPGRVPQMSCYGRLRSYTSDLITEPVTALPSTSSTPAAFDRWACIQEACFSLPRSERMRTRMRPAMDCLTVMPAFFSSPGVREKGAGARGGES